jgi:hypothetical protein
MRDVTEKHKIQIFRIKRLKSRCHRKSLKMLHKINNNVIAGKTNNFLNDKISDSTEGRGRHRTRHI